MFSVYMCPLFGSVRIEVLLYMPLTGIANQFQGLKVSGIQRFFYVKKKYNFSSNECFLYFGMSAMELLPYTVLFGKKYFGVLESKNLVNLYPARYCPNSKRIWNQIRNIRKKLEVIPNRTLATTKKQKLTGPTLKKIVRDETRTD